MGRKLFLHAGKHKTGSSSIQWYLANNEQFFADMGFRVVLDSHFAKRRLDSKNEVNCFAIAHTLIRPQLLTPTRLRGRLLVPDIQEQRKAAIRTNEYLSGLSGNSLLISAEAFSFLRTKKERQLYDLMFQGFDLHPILFLREQKSWLQSWKKQTTRLRQKFLNAELVSGSIFDYSDNSWLVDDQAITQFFGPKAHVLSYEAEIEKYGNIVPAYLRELGLLSKAAPPWDNVWENRTDYP